MALSKAALHRIKGILSAGPNDRVPILTVKQQQYAKQFAARRQREAVDTRTKDMVERTACVMIPICSVNGKPSIIFTLRSSGVTTHKNQISFPGGHADFRDSSPAETALRETKEELRGSYDYDNKILLLGIMGCVPSMNGTMVTPVVAALEDEFSDSNHVSAVFHDHNKDEVDAVFSRTVENILQSETSEPLERIGSAGPCFPGPEGKIWGLTAIILRSLLRKVLVPAFYDGKAGFKGTLHEQGEKEYQ